MSQSLTIAADEAASLQQTANDLIDQARAKGASGVEVSASISRGYSLEVRLGEVDKLEYTNDKGLGLTVYFGQQKGSASSSDLSQSALQQALDKACNIAEFTGEDSCAGIPEREHLAFNYPDCDLYHPWELTPQQAIELAKNCEQMGLDYDKQITNSEGVALDTSQGFRVFANSAGFSGGYYGSHHSLSCVLLANANQGMERDYYYTVARDPALLEAAESVAKQAAAKTIARLNPRKVKTGKYPVLMQADIARGVLGHLLSAIQGGQLYRKASFLLDSLGQQVLSPTITLQESPHLAKAIGSAPFDVEGGATHSRAIVSDGVLQTYCLSSYAARKLQLKPTGHAGGVHNVECISNDPRELSELLAQMKQGLLVTEVMGQGVNLVTGDYSRGASGFWVENGEIAYPVSEITIAGNLRDMLQKIIAVGTDVDRRGNVMTGSILFDAMTVAGE